MADATPLDRSSTAWNKYGAWNRRHEGLAAVWVRDLIAWIETSPLVGSKGSLLDFGCGYFDVGIQLTDFFDFVDGFDVNPSACDIAHMRVQEHQEKSRIFRAISDIPQHSYDIIVVNSVIQYLADVESLKKHLSLWKSLLKDRPSSRIILSDIIPRHYVAWQDAMRSLQVAAREKMLWPMMVHLWKAATKQKDLGFLQIDYQQLEKMAHDSGLSAHLLPVNLTPSRQRYSVVLACG